MNATPERIGKYQIDSLLGRGGMGEVYKAHDSTLGRFVALKIMRGPALDDVNARERFVREAQAAGGLRHPNIVTVYDLGDVEGKLYIAMEFIRGDDLEKLIKNRSPMTMEDKLNIMIQVCQGVSYAHKYQIVHRDLKPSNIRIDDEGIAKIMDFGIAKLESSNMTASGTVLGTPYYMSPEQVRGLRVDSRSDLFSLGTILYELFTYSRAFDGELATVFYRIVHEQPAPLSEYMDVSSEALQTVVDRCLEKDKTKRFQTAAELADALRQAQDFYRENNASTLIGVKTSQLYTGAEEFKLANAPEAISRTKRQGTQNSLIQTSASGAAATELTPAGTEPSKGQPTKLLSQSPFPDSPAASIPLEAQVGKTVLPQTEVSSATAVTGHAPVRPSPLKWVIPLVLIALIGAGVGGYFWTQRNQTQQTGVPSNSGQKDTVDDSTGSDQRIDPAQYEVELAKGREFYQNGQYQQASQLYDDLLEQRPKDSNLHFLSGAAKLKLGKNQEALVEFQKAVEIDQKLGKAWQQIGFLLMNRMDYQAAENAFLKAIQTDRKTPANWEGLAQTYFLQQRLDKAEQAYRNLLELEPDNVTAIYNLGRIQWANKQSDAAKKSFRKVIELNPNHAEAHNNLGAILLSEGQVAQSILENEKALELKPTLPSAHYSLFLAYEQQGNLRQAAVHLQKYMEFSNDDDPELKKKLQEYSRT